MDKPDLDQVYAQFIESALAQGCVYGLEGEDGWALTEAERNPELGVLPLWSTLETAQEHCHDAWSVYRPIPIAVSELLDDWLPGLHEDTTLVGIDWDTALEGEEVEPLDLLEDIERAMDESA